MEGITDIHQRAVGVVGANLFDQRGDASESAAAGKGCSAVAIGDHIQMRHQVRVEVI